MQWTLLAAVLVGLFACSSAELKVRNSQCKFPFRYKGHTYYYCTTADAKTPWCALDDELQGNRYVQCYPSVCVFPFTYKGKTYDSCTKEDSSDYWCSGTSNYDGTFYPCKGFDGAYDVTIYCVGADKKNYNIGQSWSQDCVNFKCLEDGKYSYTAKCPGVDGCYDIGAENFRCKIEGKTYEKCSCKGDDQSPLLYYTISKSDKNDDSYQEEKKVTRYCVDESGKKVTKWSSNCVDFECVDGKPTVVGEGCNNGNGVCYDVGMSEFKCTIRGDNYNNCACHKKHGQLVLSAKG